MDDVAWNLLSILQREGRITFAELGRRVGLSAPAVAERVRRLEDSGILAGYAAKIDLSRIGGVVTAFLRMQVSPTHYVAMCSQAKEMPEVVECHAVTGQESFMLKVVVPDLAHLDRVLARLTSYGQTVTSLVLSTHVSAREPALDLFRDESPPSSRSPAAR